MTPIEFKSEEVVYMKLSLQERVVEKMIIYRKRNKLSQKECANKIGISRSYYSDIENKRSKPSFDTLEKMNDLFLFF